MALPPRAILRGNHGCVAHLLSETPGLGGRKRSGLRPHRVPRGRAGGERDARGARAPQQVQAGARVVKISILDDYFDTLRTLPCFRKLAGHEIEIWTDHVDDIGVLADRLRQAEALVLID